MNGLTTIAAIPTGAGCAASLPAEVAPLYEIERMQKTLDAPEEKIDVIEWMARCGFFAFEDALTNAGIEPGVTSETPRSAYWSEQIDWPELNEDRP